MSGARSIAGMRTCLVLRLPLAGLALGALAGAALPGSELVVRDLDINAVALPTSFTYALTGSGSSGAGNDAFASGTGLGVGGRWSLARPGDALGLVLGLDAMLEDWTYGSSADALFAADLRASAGLGWAITPHWTAIAELGAGYGFSHLDLPASAIAPAFSASGDHFAYDVRADLRWQFARGLVFVVQGGWLHSEHSFSNGSISDLKLTQSGLYAGIGFTWRFSDAPERLE